MIGKALLKVVGLFLSLTVDWCMSVPFTPYSDGCSEEHGAGSIVQPLREWDDSGGGGLLIFLATKQ